MHARHFNLHLGRFLSTDPIGGSIGSSQSWNRYSYVLGNPINATDPTGMLTNQYGGPGDMPVNLANAGTGVTAWDAAFVRITWPMFPNVYIPSKAEKFQRAIQDALRAWGVLSEEYGLFSDQWKENFISGKYWGTGLGEDALEEYAATLSDPHASVFSKTSSAAGGILAALWTPNTYYKTYGVFVGGAAFAQRSSIIGKLFGKGGLLNRGRFLRVGWGRKGGRRVFRIAGRLISKLFGKGHIDFWDGGPL